MRVSSVGIVLALAALAVLALGIWWTRARSGRVTVPQPPPPQSRAVDNHTVVGTQPAVNLRMFGTILVLAALVVLLFGLWLWVTGTPDDGQYHVQASNVFELLEKNQAAVARRHAARLPLIIGGIGLVLGGGLMVSARRKRRIDPNAAL